MSVSPKCHPPKQGRGSPGIHSPQVGLRLPYPQHTRPPSDIGACPLAAERCSAPPSARTATCSHPHSGPRWRSQARPAWSSLRVQGKVRATEEEMCLVYNPRTDPAQTSRVAQGESQRDRQTERQIEAETETETEREMEERVHQSVCLSRGWDCC